MRYFIVISFRGTNYSGWQIQENANSVESEVEKALSIHFKEAIDVVGAGRTDAGVNALNYIAHFDSDTDDILKDLPRKLYKINAILPSDIVISDIYRVTDEAHARFDALSRTYKYFVNTGKDPFSLDFSFFSKHELDIERMNQAAALLLGKRDFSCFEKVNGGNTTSICEIYHASWEPITPIGNFPFYSSSISEKEGYCHKSSHIVFTITANRFLRNMVRAIVGTLIEVGRGKKEPEWILELIESKDRCAAGQSVPGHALFLTDISYPKEIIKR